MPTMNWLLRTVAARCSAVKVLVFRSPAGLSMSIPSQRCGWPCMRRGRRVRWLHPGVGGPDSLNYRRRASWPRTVTILTYIELAQGATVSLPPRAERIRVPTGGCSANAAQVACGQVTHRPSRDPASGQIPPQPPHWGDDPYTLRFRALPGVDARRCRARAVIAAPLASFPAAERSSLTVKRRLSAGRRSRFQVLATASRDYQGSRTRDDGSRAHVTAISSPLNTRPYLAQRRWTR